MAKDYARNKKRPSSRQHEEVEGERNWRWPLAGILIALFAAGIFYLKQQSDKLAAEQGDQGSSMIQRTMKKNVPELASPTATTKTTSTKTTVHTTPAETVASPPPQPKFDFYTMLPNGQQTANTNTAAAPQTTTTPPPATTTVTPATQPAAAATPATTNKQPAKQQLEKSAQADTSDLIAMEIKKLSAEKTNKSKAETNNAKTGNHYVVQLGVFKNYNDADQLKAQLVLQGLDVNIKDYKKQNNTLYHVYMGPYSSLASAKKQQHLLAENQIKSKIAKE